MDSKGQLFEWVSEEQHQQTLEQMQEKPLIPLTPEEYQELKPMGATRRKNHMRNKPCLCGSGKKFKRCCWNQYG